MNARTTFDHRSGRRLEIDGARIYYEVAGDESAPALLFLHGGLGNIEDFNPVLAGLDRPYRLIGIDSRGQGGSTLGAGPLTYERIQNDVAAVLAHLGVDTLSVVGFSDGGIVALRLAALTSLQIRKLVAIGTDGHSAGIEPVRAILGGVTGESWRRKFPDTVEAYERQNPEPDFDRLVRAVVGMWLDAGPAGYPDEAVRSIACPLLVVRGDDDHLVARDAAAALCGRVPNARLLNLPYAGHLVFDGQKEIFLSILNRFLGE